MDDGVIVNVPNTKALASKLQDAGIRMWANMFKGDWAGRDVEQLSPQSFSYWEEG